jgi:glycosyltransferase involved in cell wall biosynthesis
MKEFISVVIPVYGCNDCLIELYKRLKQAIEEISDQFEIILVNDAYPSNAWEIIKDLAENDYRVKGINLSRNFGQHYAISAGLGHAEGEYIIVMDCDLQDQPEEIIKLYNTANEGFDIVLARRIIRKDSFFKRSFSRMFYKLLGYLTDTVQDNTIANFGIYNKKVIRTIRNMGDSIKYFPTMVRWVGFKTTCIDVEHAERENGKSSYSFKKLSRLALDIILSFSEKPLKLVLKFGLSMSFISFIMGVIYLYQYLTGNIKVLGFASIIISIWFLAGIIIFISGIVGLYIGKIFEKVKNRPVYIISEKINFKDISDV